MSEAEVFDALRYRVEVDARGTRWYYNSANQLHRVGRLLNMNAVLTGGTRMA